MDKISGIVKASPRLTSVDLRDAAPVRPGTPSFGRPEAVSSLKEPLSFGVATPKSVSIQNEALDWRAKDSQKAAIATELSEKFFIKNRTQAEPARMQESSAVLVMPIVMPRPETMSKPAGFKTDVAAETSPMRFDSEVFADEDESAVELQQPEGLFPKGSFIDRTV